MGASTPKSIASLKDSRKHVWTREEIASHILAGDSIVVHRQRVLRIPHAWLTSHPGGELAILHFVGRDASDEIEAYHSRETLDGLMQSFVVGSLDVGEGIEEVDGGQGKVTRAWEPFVPPLMSGWVFKYTNGKGKGRWVNEAKAVRSQTDTALSPSSQILLVAKKAPNPSSGNEKSLEAPTLETISASPSTLSLEEQHTQSSAYKALHERVKAAGLYETPFISGYGPEVLRYLLLASLSTFCYSKGWFVASAICLGLLWHQLSFIVHDLGHVGVTHNWAVDRVLGIFLADFVGGLSIGWWVDNHNVHHLVTNHPSHDPDIEHIPFFAISPHFLSSLYSSYYKRLMTFDGPARFFLSLQHKLFYVVMSLARFNLFANSYIFLFKTAGAKGKVRGGRWSWWAEIIAIALFWSWYGGVVLRGTGTWKSALVYLLVTNVVASPLHVQIVLSHFSRSTADLGPTESFPHRQLRTTTDVICPSWLDFLHGGLHLQVTHHLFPRLPRHQLRAASFLVKEFANEHGLEYAEFGFREGNMEVVSVLRSVAEQVKVVGIVAEAGVRDAMESSKKLQ